MGERRTPSDNMNSLLTEIWRCVQIADEKGEDIQIHLHPQTIAELELAVGTIVKKPPFSIVGKGDYATLFGKEIISDEDIVIDSFVIQRVIRVI